MSERERGGRDGFSVSISDRERGASVTSQSVRPMCVCMYVCMGYRSVYGRRQMDGWKVRRRCKVRRHWFMLGSCVPSVTIQTVGEGGREGGSAGACVRRSDVGRRGWAGKEPTHPPVIRPWSHDGR